MLNRKARAACLLEGDAFIERYPHEPWAHVDHVESWLLAKVEGGPTEAAFDASLLPLVGETT